MPPIGTRLGNFQTPILGILRVPITAETERLYRAPVYRKKESGAEQEKDAVVDRASQELEAKFGRKEVQEAQGVHRQLLENARDRGLLVPATREKTS